MIETKFNIEDIVYTVDYYCDSWYPNKTQFKIEEIINYIKTDRQDTTFYLKSNNYNCIADANLCFRSYNEAKAWCDTRNGEN